MIVALVLLTIVALVAAIGAIYRVRDKYKIQRAFNVQDVTTADKPQLQPDIDSEQPISTVEEPTEEPTEESIVSPEAPNVSLIVPPFATSPEIEIPLASSIGVTDVLQPQTIESPHLDLDQSDIPQRENHVSPSVLEEVAQLESADEIMDRLTRQATDSDSSVRVAVAAALGEIAIRGQRDRAISLLTQLSQDVDPIVRTQAATSLGNIPLDIV